MDATMYNDVIFDWYYAFALLAYQVVYVIMARYGKSKLSQSLNIFSRWIVYFCLLLSTVIVLRGGQALAAPVTIIVISFTGLICLCALVMGVIERTKTLQFQSMFNISYDHHIYRHDTHIGMNFKNGKSDHLGIVYYSQNEKYENFDRFKIFMQENNRHTTLYTAIPCEATYVNGIYAKEGIVYIVPKDTKEQWVIDDVNWFNDVCERIV
jgi:hypothetical protein